MNLYNLDNENALAELKKISVYKSENILRKVLKFLQNRKTEYIISNVSQDDVGRYAYTTILAQNFSKLKYLYYDGLAVVEVCIDYSGIKIKYIKKNNVPVNLKRKILIEELVGE